MRLLRIFFLPLLALGLFLPPLAWGGGAHAASPTISVNPSSVAVNGSFALSGSGFVPGQTLVIKLDSSTLSSGVVTDRAGNFGPTTYTAPAGITSGAHTLSADSIDNQLLASTALQVTAQSVTLLLTPTGGAPGAQILAGGSGFTANEPVSIALGATVLANTTANAQGQISVSLTLPRHLPVGPNTMVATGSTSHMSGNAVYMVAAPSLTLSAPSGASGGSLTAVGHNYAAGEVVQISFAGAPVAQATADGSGSFSSTFIVPTGPSGAVQVGATGADSAIALTASFTRIGAAAALTLAPANGAPGMHIQVSGSGFTANEPVSIALGATVLANTTANAQGQISTSVALPQHLAVGSSTLVATGATSHASGSAVYTVNAPTLILSAPSGPSAGNLTVVGHNFAVGETVRVSFAGTVVAQATADGAGSFTATFAVPTGPSGVQAVAATGITSLIVTNASFTRTGAVIKANVTAITTGGALNLSGSGFGANEPIQITIPGAVLLNIRADAQGNFSTPLTIPASHAAGAVVISATGQTTRQVGSVTITVVVGPRIVLSAPAAQAGNSVTVTGTGFGAGEAISLALGNIAVGRSATNAQGAFTVAVTIPLTTPAAGTVLTATGQQTHRSAQASVNVTSRQAAALTVSPGTVLPGARLTINGSGFTPGEVVTLTTSGGQSFATATANAQGRFTITPVLPASSVPGIEHIKATGNTSRIAASIALTVAAPVSLSTRATTWYFAAGQTANDTTLSIAVLNSNTSAVQGTLTLFYGTGQTRAIPFSLAAQTRGSYNIGQIAGPLEHVAVMVQANLPIAAASSSNTSGGNDRIGTSGVSAASRTWYMAEGYTGLSFTETLYLLNPSSAATTVHISWPLGNGKAPIKYDLTVPARTQMVIPVNTYVKHASHATMINSDQPIVVARRIVFGTSQQGATLDPGATRSATTLYFAEGSTANGFEEYLTIFNPDDTRVAQVNAQFHDQLGRLLGTRSITIDPMSRGTIEVNTVAHSSSIASVLHSNLPIVAERALYFGAPNGNSAGGTVVFGRASSAMGWTFADGDTSPGRKEFDLLYNPNSRANDILLTYYTASGQVVNDTFTVPANARITVDVIRSVTGLPRGLHGLAMRSLSGVPFLAEQALYNQNLTRGSASAGAPAS